ncbi:hypothetical protein V8F20_012643 [Naviculisporaceae sp. PSN 640]
MAVTTPQLTLRGLLITQILLPLAYAQSAHEAQIPISNQGQKHDHNPKHNDSKHQQHDAQSHVHEKSWTGCLPGPLIHPHHPACELINDEPSDDFPPWTHEPFCLPGSAAKSKDGKAAKPFIYCTFSNAKYPSETKGVSIIANPDDPQTEKSLSAIGTLFESGKSGEEDELPLAKKEPATLAYKITPLPGKGMGLIATRKIKQGEVIMVDHAALIAEMAFPTRVKRDVGRQLLERAVRRLSPERKEMVLGLASNEGGEVDVEDVVRTNSFTVNVGEGSFMALFPRIARINHACKPTAFTRFNEKTLSNTVLAFREISKGEEITISYSDFGLTHAERTPLLSSKWGFKCTCSLCTSPPAEIAASDKRRLKIKALGPEVISQVEAQNFGKAIELNEEMVDLIHTEGLVPHRGEHWEVMARLYLANGNAVKEARKYLRKAIKEMEEFGGSWGDDSGEEKIEELRGWLAKLA